MQFGIKISKGQYNVVADALKWMPKIESLSFLEIKSCLLNNVHGKYEHPLVYKDVWKLVLGRDPSPQDSAQVVANLPHMHLWHRAMRCNNGKTFLSTKAYYSTRVEYVCYRSMTLGAKYFMNVMTFQVQVI